MILVIRQEGRQEVSIFSIIKMAAVMVLSHIVKGEATAGNVASNGTIFK
jgi:hypothetical protein